MRLAAATASLMTMLGAFSATAAELPQPVVQSPADAAVAPDWTGLYGGVHFGVGSGLYVPRGRDVGPDVHTSGVIGGGQLGANWQWGQLLFGGETDISGTDVTGAFDRRTSFRSTLNYIGTVRGRIGYAFDRFLVYGTGGFAYSHDQDTLRFRGRTRFDSAFRTGWAAGAGVEAAIDARWSARLEYLYAELGDETYRWRFAPGVRAGGVLNYQQHLLRIGLNYKF